MMYNKNVVYESCPFCGGTGKLHYRQIKFYGHNVIGSCKIRYGAQVVCNRCHARGPLYTRNLFTNTLDEHDAKAWLQKEAINGWNGRCEVKNECTNSSYVDPYL